MANAKRGGFFSFVIFWAVVGLLGLYGYYGFAYPWIFTVGERFRFIPIWEGKATAQGPGGRYDIYINFSPSDGPSVVPSTWISGYGYICAPQGHSYNVRVGGGTNSMVWKNMNNLPFGLYTRGPTSVAHMLAEAGLPPALEFHGRWQGSKLVQKDDGTITAAFLADGTLNPKAPINLPAAEQEVVFEEQFWGLTNPCK